MNPRLSYVGKLITFLFVLFATIPPPVQAQEDELLLRFNPGTKAEECAKCHELAHKEWLNGPSEKKSELQLVTGEIVNGTMHAYAWQDALFRAEYEYMGEPELCRRCHMPVSAYSAHSERGVYAPDPRPMASPNYNEGVTCVTCHLDQDGVLRGPPRRVEEASRPTPHVLVVDPDMSNAVFCSACHDDKVLGALTETYTEWTQSPVAGEVNCQNCHMPENQHIWPGAHNTDMVSRAFEATIPITLDSQRPLSLTLENVGAGHNVPTGESFRGYVVDVQVLTHSGALLMETEVVIAPEIKTPIYYAEEIRKRLDPIEPGTTREMLVGFLEAGTYEVIVNAWYQLEREVTLVYWDGSTRHIEATEDKPVLSIQQQLVVR